ncbi:YfiR family protein [Archangium sp.]|uniref:YfiR family protein n=1 Tax=Archangium sp. TaxID=1872627 RepID=UPI002ED8A23F
MAPLVLMLASAPVHAEELPATLRASLVVRILAYDRRMSSHPPPLTIAILHQEGDTSSARGGQELRTAMEAAARGRTLAGQPMRVLRIGFRNALQLQEELSRAGVVALYACEGLEAQSEVISRVTRQLSILSLAGSAAQVNRGLAIGLIRKKNSPVILVNLSAARAEGADLDAGLLSLAQLVEPRPGQE